MSPRPAEPLERATVTVDRAPFLPFLEPRTARPPGLSPLDPAGWIVTGPDYAAQMRLRARLMAERPGAVLGQCPGAEAGLTELLAMLRGHLGDRGDFTAAGARALRRPDGAVVALDEARPLETISTLVAEDFCLMERAPGAGEYRLTAAALCFPSRWALAEKLGRPLTAIHDPVPDYDEALARRVARVFDMLAPGRPVFRVNWLMHQDPALHQTEHRPPPAGRLPGPAAGLYLRTEHQTLTRLPQTGAVAFGIRTHVVPVEALAPAVRARLCDGLAALAPATVDYRIGAGELAEGTGFVAGLGGAAPAAPAAAG